MLLLFPARRSELSERTSADNARAMEAAAKKEDA
jgi:hypothetical protein